MEKPVCPGSVVVAGRAGQRGRHLEINSIRVEGAHRAEVRVGGD